MVHVLDLLPAYALGILDQWENLLVKSHLENCESCQEDLRAYESVVAELSFLCPQVPPSPGLRTRLLHSIQASMEEEKLASSSNKVQKINFRFSFWQWLVVRTPVLIGVSLILVLAVSNIFLWNEVASLQAEAAASQMLTRPLFSAGEPSGATGLVVMDPQGKFGTIIVDSLSPSSEDVQYHVWLSQDDGRIESGGILTVHGSGYGAQIIYAPEPLILYSRVWITIEPAGDIEQPAGVVILQTNP